MAQDRQDAALAGRQGEFADTDPAHAATLHDGHAPTERPEDWGWHHEWKRTTPVLGWLFVIGLLLLTFGNHEGHVEDYFLGGAAAFMAFILIRSQLAKRNAWRN